MISSHSLAVGLVFLVLPSRSNEKETKTKNPERFDSAVTKAFLEIVHVVFTILHKQVLTSDRHAL